MTIHTAEAALKAAEEVLADNTIVRSTDTFEVLAVPESLTMFSAYALLLYLPDQDMGKGNTPQNTMIIPVTVNDRKGYFIDRDVAQTYA